MEEEESRESGGEGDDDDDDDDRAGASSTAEDAGEGQRDEEAEKRAAGSYSPSPSCSSARSRAPHPTRIPRPARSPHGGDRLCAPPLDLEASPAAAEIQSVLQSFPGPLGSCFGFLWFFRLSSSFFCRSHPSPAPLDRALFAPDGLRRRADLRPLLRSSPRRRGGGRARSFSRSEDASSLGGAGARSGALRGRLARRRRALFSFFTSFVFCFALPSSSCSSGALCRD